MLRILSERGFEHTMQALDVGRVDIPPAAARLEDEQRVSVKSNCIEVAGILRGNLGHCVGVGLVLLAALGRVEIFHVADAQRLDEGALGGRRLVFQADGLLHGRVGERRLIRGHRAIQVRTPRPAFAPVTNCALGIALGGFAERAHRVETREGVHHLEALVEKRLGFFIR